MLLSGMLDASNPTALTSLTEFIRNARAIIRLEGLRQ